MSNAIEILEKLTKEEQEKLLTMVSDSSSDLAPIEIDSIIYQIPIPVHKLIDNLALQIKELSGMHEDFVIN
tara:strand:- start:425 stop:637 length:213 start_codon:yes stop_codon:yes gene_type:complete